MREGMKGVVIGIKKKDTKPNLRLVSIVGMNQHEELMERSEW